MVGRVLELAHEVARDEHRAAFRGERAEEAAHPADPLGIEAVDRLVEEQDRWIAEKCRPDSEALGHAEREAARATSRNLGEPDELEHLVDPALGQPVAAREPQQVIAGASPGMGRARVEKRAHLAKRAPSSRYRFPFTRASPVSGRSSPRITRIVVDLPAPFGPTKPVTSPR